MKRCSYVKYLLLISLLLVFFSSMAIAEEEYIKDTTGKIDKETIQIINSNLSTLERDHQIKVLIMMINNTGSKPIEKYALDIGKDLRTSRYAIFVTSIEDRKNHFLVGDGIRNLFTKEEIDKFSSIPNDEFKKGEFSKGIAKVESNINYHLYGKIESEKKEKQQQINTERYERLQREKPHTKLRVLLAISAIILMFGIPIYLKKRLKCKNKRTYQQNKRSRAKYNNKHRKKKRRKNSDYKNHGRAKGGNYQGNSNGHNYSNNQSSDSFVNGMIIGSIINDSHSSGYHSGSYSSSGEESTVSDNSSTSNWDSDSSSNSSSSSWWDSSSNDSSSSSWDSSSSNSSTSSWDSGSSSSSCSSSDSSSTSDW